MNDLSRRAILAASVAGGITAATTAKAATIFGNPDRPPSVLAKPGRDAIENPLLQSLS